MCFYRTVTCSSSAVCIMPRKSVRDDDDDDDLVTSKFKKTGFGCFYKSVSST